MIASVTIHHDSFVDCQSSFPPTVLFLSHSVRSVSGFHVSTGLSREDVAGASASSCGHAGLTTPPGDRRCYYKSEELNYRPLCIRFLWVMRCSDKTVIKKKTKKTFCYNSLNTFTASKYTMSNESLLNGQNFTQFSQKSFVWGASSKKSKVMKQEVRQLNTW